VCDYPAYILTFVDLRQLPTAIRKIEANGQTSVQPGLHNAHTFDPVNPTDFDTPNVLIGRYKPHFYSPNHRRPTLFLVDVDAISSPLLGTEDTHLSEKREPQGAIGITYSSSEGKWNGPLHGMQ
jgi:hypothetical protein